MALILPPSLNYDSFVSLADATVVIEALTLDGPDWASTPVDDQERYLRIATRNIKNGIDLTINPIDPAVIPACLPEATALMAIHDIKNNISNSVVSTSVTGAIKKEQVGSIVQEYYDVAAGNRYINVILTLFLIWQNLVLRLSDMFSKHLRRH